MKRANRRTTEEPPREAAAFTPCYCCGAGPRVSALMGGMFQGPAFDHFRQAQVEVLMGLRAILDAQIDRMTRQQGKGTRVTVE